jgi:hypothetical protein
MISRCASISIRASFRLHSLVRSVQTAGKPPGRRKLSVTDLGAGSAAQLSVVDNQRYTQGFILGSRCFQTVVSGYLPVEPYKCCMSLLHRSEVRTLIPRKTQLFGYQELLRQQRQ